MAQSTTTASINPGQTEAPPTNPGHAEALILRTFDSDGHIVGPAALAKLCAILDAPQYVGPVVAVTR